METVEDIIKLNVFELVDLIKKYESPWYKKGQEDITSLINFCRIVIVDKKEQIIESEPFKKFKKLFNNDVLNFLEVDVEPLNNIIGGTYEKYDEDYFYNGKHHIVKFFTNGNIYYKLKIIYNYNKNSDNKGYQSATFYFLNYVDLCIDKEIKSIVEYDAKQLNNCNIEELGDAIVKYRNNEIYLDFIKSCIFNIRKRDSEVFELDLFKKVKEIFVNGKNIFEIDLDSLKENMATVEKKKIENYADGKIQRIIYDNKYELVLIIGSDYQKVRLNYFGVNLTLCPQLPIKVKY